MQRSGATAGTKRCAGSDCTSAGLPVAPCSSASSAPHGGAAPQTMTHPGELDLQWQNLTPAASEPDTPRWFERAQRRAAQRFLRLVAGGRVPRAAVRATPCAGAAPTPEPLDQPAALAAPGLILKALRLVQSKVQVTNVTGDGPYLPADPAIVLQRGYGDSRDLARLLVMLLRRVAVDAQVALANSRGELLDTSLPSPLMLDCAVVLARAGGVDYWLNPGSTCVRGFTRHHRPGRSAPRAADFTDGRQADRTAPPGAGFKAAAGHAAVRSARRQFPTRRAATDDAVSRRLGAGRARPTAGAKSRAAATDADPERRAGLSECHARRHRHAPRSAGTTQRAAAGAFSDPATRSARAQRSAVQFLCRSIDGRGAAAR